MRRRRLISCPLLMFTPRMHTGLMPTLPSGGISLRGGRGRGCRNRGRERR